MFKLLVTWQPTLFTSLTTETAQNKAYEVDTFEQCNSIIENELQQTQAQVDAEDRPYVVYFEGFTHGILQQYECFILTPERS